MSEWIVVDDGEGWEDIDYEQDNGDINEDEVYELERRETRKRKRVVH